MIIIIITKTRHSQKNTVRRHHSSITNCNSQYPKVGSPSPFSKNHSVLKKCQNVSFCTSSRAISARFVTCRTVITKLVGGQKYLNFRSKNQHFVPPILKNDFWVMGGERGQHWEQFLIASWCVVQGRIFYTYSNFIFPLLSSIVHS